MQIGASRCLQLFPSINCDDHLVLSKEIRATILRQPSTILSVNRVSFLNRNIRPIDCNSHRKFAAK